MSNRITIALCCCVLAACGGGKDEHVNAATSTNFSYGPEQSWTPPSSASDAISSIASFQASADEASAVAVQGALMQVAFEALPDDVGLGGFAATAADPNALVRDARARTLKTAFGTAAAATQFTGECTVVQHGADGVTTVTFGNCQFTEVSTDGSSATVTVNGKVVGRPGAVTWDVRYGAKFSSADARIDFAYHDVGDVAVTPATVVAHQEADIAASVSSGGQSASLGVAQSVDLDVAIDSTCATNITGGTLEAKRVWTNRGGASQEELRNAGALFTWTGCGIATVQFSR